MMTATTGAALAPWRQDASVIGLVGLAHASSHFSQLLLPAMFPVFMREFGWSYAQLGLLMSVFFVVSGLGQAIAGFLVDRLGARRVMLASVLCFVLACLAAAWGQGYTGLMLVAVLAGLGNAPFHPVDFTILNHRVSGPRLGYAFSVHGLTGNLGWAAAPVFLVGLSEVWGWRGAYLAAAAVYAAIAVLLLIYREHLETHTAGRAHEQSHEGVLAFMKLQVIWACFAFFMLGTVVSALVQSYSVSLLQALYGVSLHAATWTVTAYMLCGALGVFAGGFVAVRMASHSDRVVAICMGVGGVLLALCGTEWIGATGTMGVLAFAGFAISIGNPSRDLLVRKVTPKGATGRVYGLVYSGFDAGLALAPPLLGLLMDHGWFRATFWVCSASLALALLAVTQVGKSVRS